ncbi:MAG: GAF domain-containing protein [Burkholderiales bacterium]|nr:GAF domain-containing protein [Burkholderiales bacterium]
MFHLDKTDTPDYASLDKQLAAMLEGERDFIANAAQFSAFVNQMIDDLNWAGFYLLKDGELVLGPFQGKVACVRIALGKGVCGTAAATRETVLVEDVHAFPGHIACDAASASEIVIPLIKNGELIGVFDVDSPRPNRFGKDDQAGLEKLVARFLDSFDSWF